MQIFTWNPFLLSLIVNTSLFFTSNQFMNSHFPNANWRNFVAIPHSLEKREILSRWKKISSNQLFSNFISKSIAFTKFLQKKCERDFLQFPHCALWNYRNSLSMKKISSNQLFSNFFSKSIAFTKYLGKKCERDFLQFPHCAECRVKNNSWNQFIVLFIWFFMFLAKILNSRKFYKNLKFD